MIKSIRSHRAFVSNTVWQYGLQVAKYVFPLLVLPYLTRVLEPKGYAVYAYVVSFMTIARVFVEFGFNLLGTKEIADSADVGEANQVIGSITQARILLSLASLVVTLFIALMIPITRANLAYTMLAFIGVCLTSLSPDFVFQGNERMGPLTSRFVMSKGIATILTFVVVKNAGDLIWIPILDIVAGTIALVWSFVVIDRLFGMRFARAPLIETLKALKTSAVYCVSNVASSFLTSFTTLFVGFAITDPAQISFWSIGITAVSAITSLYTPVVNSLYPHMLKTRDFSFAKRLMVAALPVLLLIVVLLVVLSDHIMLVFGGEAYTGGSLVLVETSPVALFSFYSMLFGWPMLGAIGRVNELTRSTVLAALFSVVSLIALYLAHAASLHLVCVIRVATEMILCGLRLFECMRSNWGRQTV